MKKKLPYIILIAILVLFIVACSIGIALFGWQTFTEEFKNNMNQPIPLIGISCGAGLIFLFVLFSKTSIGKKSLNTMKDLVVKANDETKKARDTLIETKKAINDYKDLKEAQIREIKETYETLLVGVKQETKAYQDLTIEIAREINNKNIQKKVDAFVENQKDIVYNEVSGVVENAKEEARSEYQSQLDDLQKQINDIKEFGVDSKKEFEEDLTELKEGVING